MKMEEEEFPDVELEEIQGSSSSSSSSSNSVQYVIENNENIYNQIVYDSTVFCGNYYLPIDNQTIFIQNPDIEESTAYHESAEIVAYDESDEVAGYDDSNEATSTECIQAIYSSNSNAADAFVEATETAALDESGGQTVLTEPFEILYSNPSELHGQVVFQSADEEEAAPFQYAIDENGELVLQQLNEQVEERGENIDISQVFGKNLITGQMVTIPEHYLQVNLGDDLLNKKISLGILSNGKPLFGKILEIQRADDNMAVKVVKEEKAISLEYVELVQKNMCALMEMETVKDKILEKPLAVKLTERKGKEIQTIGKIRGFLELNEATNTWGFVDFNSETDSEEYLKSVKFKLRYASPVHITLSVTRENEVLRTTKVSFNPPTKTHTCILCHKEMKTLKSLNRHYIASHDQFEDLTNETMFLCPICNRLFKSASSLRRHQAIHNPELRGFECTTCKQRFTDNSSLKKHLLLHTGVKPHSCELCGRAFTNVGDLNSHRHIHLQQGRTRFTCQTCGRSFAKHNNMLRHSRIHKDGGFGCPICGCNFKHSSSLTRHIVHAHVSSETSVEDTQT